MQGKPLAYFVYAAVMTAAVLGLWAIGTQEHQARLERMRHEAGDVSARVEMLVGSSVDHVDMLRRQAETLLAEPTSPFAARRLFAALAPSDGFSGYAIDQLPVGVDPHTVGNLTGSGAVPPIVSGAGREMLMALALNPLFKATHSQIPNTAWVYYTSKNHFMAIQPWVPSRDFHWSEDLLGYDFFKLGGPDRNPDREAFWTDIYVDAAGKGLMATVGMPVYDQSGQFRGTIDLDLTMGTMNRLLSHGEFGSARALLVNDQNRVVADSAATAMPLGALTGLGDVLPQSASLRKAALSQADAPDVFVPHDRWLLYTTAIKGAPWRLVMAVERRTLALAVVRSIWIGFVGVALLAIALVAVEQRRLSAGALAAHVAALKGVTLNLAAARDEAQQANSAKSMLLANVSHELRTPLNAIIGFSDMMRHQVYGPLGHGKYEGYADDIQKSGQLLLDLINDLLDATKLEAGHYEIAESECDLGAILDEAIGLVKLQAERAGVAVRARINGTVPPLYADPRALRQIVLNLLSNAIKFTPAEGAVRISCALNSAGDAVVTVEDTGRGIAPEDIKNLFHPFARTAEAKRAGLPGTGLGLAIVKSLVELHQGTISMESRLGQGTTVTVLLPARRVMAQRVSGAA
jgi:signal transduction histidine kinase